MSKKRDAHIKVVTQKEKAKRYKENESFGVTFVNLHLGVDDKRKILELSEQGIDYALVIDNLVADGYKLSITPDFNNDTIIVSMTGKFCIEENIGKCITARGATVTAALTSLGYKWQHLCLDGIFPSNEFLDDELSKLS